MLTSVIFYCVVGFQLWLVSHYYAKRACHGLTALQHTSTPLESNVEQQKPVDFAKFISQFKRANQVIFSLGLSSLALLLYWELEQNFQPPSMFAVVLFMVQLAPFALIDITEKRHFQWLKQVIHQPKRSGSIVKRTLLTFVPLKLMLVALACILLTIVFDLSVHANQQPLWQGFNEQALHRSITLIITNGLLFALVFKTIYSQKKDPQQAQANHLDRVKFTVQSLFYLSIAMSCYFTLQSLLVALAAEQWSAGATAIYAVVVAYASVGNRVRCMNNTTI